MAILKNQESTSLVMEIANGVDDNGSTTYRKKTFTSVNVTATPENVHAVAAAIAAVLENATRDFILKDTSKLVNQG